MSSISWYQLDKKWRTIYGRLVAMSLLYILPIMLADRYYNDDLGRSLYGSSGWSQDGRPLGAKLFSLMCGDWKSPIVDISPLPLIMAILVLSYAITIYAREKLSILSENGAIVMILFLVIGNPLAISNLSYKYDCIIMFLALSIPFVVYAMVDHMSGNKTFLCSVVSGIAIMSLYQPAIGMCIVLLLIAIFLHIIDNKRERVVQNCIATGGIMCGVVFYMLFIAPVFVDSEGWRHEASQTVHLSDLESFRIVIANIANIFNYIKKYMFGTSKLYLGILGIMIILAWGGILLLDFARKESA